MKIIVKVFIDNTYIPDRPGVISNHVVTLPCDAIMTLAGWIHTLSILQYIVTQFIYYIHGICTK